MDTPIMQMVVIPQSVWENVLDTLNYLKQRNSMENASEWVSLEEALKILNIGKTTWHKYAIEKRIPFSQSGKKILLKRSDINAYLNKSLIK